MYRRVFPSIRIRFYVFQFDRTLTAQILKISAYKKRIALEIKVFFYNSFELCFQRQLTFFLGEKQQIFVPWFDFMFFISYCISLATLFNKLNNEAQHFAKETVNFTKDLLRKPVAFCYDCF